MPVDWYGPRFDDLPRAIPRVGRPNRGKRSKVKASRKAARKS